jgi:hypothetical protein
MIIIPEIDASSFYVQTPRAAPGYWYIMCPHCGLTWHLPRDPTQRTKEALKILSEHTRGHQLFEPSHKKAS